MDNLKPCPFCGMDAEYWGEEDMVWCRCTSCLAQRIYKFDEPEEAAKDWNERVPDINIPADRLQEICEAEGEGRLFIFPTGLMKKQYVCLTESVYELLEPVMERAHKAAEAALKVTAHE